MRYAIKHRHSRMMPDMNSMPRVPSTTSTTRQTLDLQSQAQHDARHQTQQRLQQQNRPVTGLNAACALHYKHH